MSNRLTYIIAGVIILVMFLTAFFSMEKTSLTFDELAHIPAGYSYLTEQDYRINPEHPPLVKDIAALPLLFLDLNFPSEDQTWLQTDSAPAWWVQFDLGKKFIYGSGNNPEEIIFWSRIPMIAILLLFGLFLFKWAKELAGNEAALAVLALFSFSPTFLSNGVLVTNDVGAAFGAVLSAYFWLKFLYNPKRLNIILAGLFFGLAMLCKFSMVLLIPFFGIITIIYSLLTSQPQKKMRNLFLYISKAVLVGLIALIFVVLPLYQFHISNYPAEQQKRDTISDLTSEEFKPLNALDIWMSDKPILRPFSQYLRGILMASQRTIFGNTVYFLGEISSSAWWYYFPVIFLLKVPLSFHLLALLTIIGLIFLVFKKKPSVKDWIKENFTVFSFLVFIFIYWTTAMAGNLNIGIRHLMPAFPFIFMLLVLGLKTIILEAGWITKKLIFLISGLFFVWYIASSLSAFPYYIPYYNEIAGGTENGYKYAVDSNYDWGQDFYYLLSFVGENDIDKIYVDYFGGESPEYWLGGKYVQLNPKEIKEPPKGWVAVSLNQLQGGVAKPVPGFDQETGYYDWLKNYTPVARMGYSILVYYID